MQKLTCDKDLKEGSEQVMHITGKNILERKNSRHKGTELGECPACSRSISEVCGWSTEGQSGIGGDLRDKKSQMIWTL